jgi:hypothetical protein
MTVQDGRGRASGLALEGIVVILSILIAFALDATWQQAELKRDLRLDLENVASEIDGSRQRVLYHLDITARVMAASGLLYGRMAASDAPAIVAPDTTIWLAGVSSSLDASLGAIDALLASGRMSAIDDPELASRLAGFRDRVEDVVEEQIQARDVARNQLSPHLVHFDRGPISHIGESFWATERVAGRVLESRGPATYPSSPSIRHFLADRRGLYLVSMGELESLLAELDAISARIDAAL